LARNLLVAVVVSGDGGASIDANGQRTLTFLRDYQDENHLKGRTTFVNVFAKDSITRLVRAKLSEAAGAAFVDGNAVVFYSPNAVTCKLLLTALGAPQ